MGCSQSRLDDEEAVKLCKDRKRFIKQAVEQRAQFATEHVAYIQCLKRVSAALLDYFEGDESHHLPLDSFISPPSTPVKKTSPLSFIPISSKSFSPTTIEFEPKSTLKVNYLRPGGTPAISVEERPQSPEVVRVETYYPMHQFGIDGFFPMQSSPMNSSVFAYSPNNRPNIPPPSPQSSLWESFWNPFSSLDYYGYPNQSSFGQTGMDNEIGGLRQVREEEGIPDLEEDGTEQKDFDEKGNVAEVRGKIDVNSSKEQVTVEDVDEHKEKVEGTASETGNANEVTEQANGGECLQVSKAQTAGQEMETGNQEAKEDTPGFTVYVNRRPTSMAEVIRDLEAQFTVICNAANDVSALLEAKKTQNSAAPNELSASKMLNPIALFRSASLRTSSSRILVNSSYTTDEDFEGTDDPSEEDCLFSAGHQSTLDKLYAWEKKLYEEVRSGERVRIAYDKKCQQLRNHDVNGEEPSSIDKTRAAIGDLHTQITVSIHSVESISRRIEALRDEELHPQLFELVQGLAKMWKVMAECHQAQQRTLDEAKILLVDTDARKQFAKSLTDRQRLARSVSSLETELRHWRNTFASWISSQRSYIHGLTGWLLRCVRCEHDPSKLACSPRRSSGTHPLFGLCVQWSRRLDVLQETAVLDGIDSFVAGIGSFYVQQSREETRRNQVGSKEQDENMKMVEVCHVEEVMSTEKLAEVAIEVLCAGMSTAMSSMAEFSVDYAEGYNEIVKKWEYVNLQQISCGTDT
ncbi:nitrate regulatory gene2 protein [Vigna radiata var. radiata]|uniref:Nitrate regulatory gene2 protein n=1 Tax=Vigna radiata var. radiata TaxID=3916 RepID=A0A1S3UMS4_VIGRR|nr:nitrate regulatory gene2 protein [Vigna radiata var. radiata]XP_022639626.1 nitrate regulatory gene2 protein [Vigna radiata var. radiata]XP_022639627.1 nitrate regulatory gene2 protein [Vigna radiata var. radiata]XP_022639628.1 nitrate regulatory gene2 protein [Vigna radiata var. radiata]